MNYLLSVFFILLHLSVSAQRFELGANVGFNYPGGTEQYRMKEGRIGLTASAKALYKIGIVQTGLLVEAGSINSTHGGFEDMYNPTSGKQIYSHRGPFRQSIARPYYSVSGILNISGGRFYCGILAGYAQMIPENEYVEYDLPNDTAYVRVFRGKAHGSLSMGTHFGYTYYLKNIGINAEAAARYIVQGPFYDFGATYNVFVFPITVGIRYKL